MEESEISKKAVYESEKADRKKESKKHSQKWKINNASRWISIGILLFGALFALWKMSSSNAPQTSSSASSTAAPTASPIDVLTIQDDDWVKGDKNALVTLVEYLDFECEACGAYHPLMKRLSEEYGDRVAFVSRYFPLPGHKNSMTAARAVEAAGKQDKYWEMYDALFQDQKSWSERPKADPQLFEGYAEKLGLDMGRFRQDVDSKETKERIERDRKAAEKLGAQGTPTFFLGSEKIKNPRGYEDFKSLLEKELNQ